MGSPSPVLLDRPAAKPEAPPRFVYERRQPELGALHRAVRTGWPQVKALGIQLALGRMSDITPFMRLPGLRPTVRLSDLKFVLQRWNQRGAPRGSAKGRASEEPCGLFRWGREAAAPFGPTGSPLHSSSFTFLPLLRFRLAAADYAKHLDRSQLLRSRGRDRLRSPPSADAGHPQALPARCRTAGRARPGARRGDQRGAKNVE